MTAPTPTPRQQRPLRNTSKDTGNDRSFQLSRIYAKGWNKAKALSSDNLLDLDSEKIAAMNPYRLEDERRRWIEGFAAGSLA